ncbi:MAG: PAS domain-containing sensor histidine kinase, partial [Cellulosilyticaceae bacterium]
MLRESLKSKILDSAPGRYFYGHIIRTEEGIDLEVIESNEAKESWSNRRITQIELFRPFNIDWQISLSEALNEGIYNTRGCYIKKVDENELVAWHCNIENKELIETREELETQKSLLELFIDSIPEIVFYKDRERNYIVCNDALAKLIDKPKEEIIGRRDSEVDVLQFQAHKCKEFDQKVIDSKTGITVEEKVFLPSGEVRIMESLKAPFWGPHKDLLGVIGICRDITEKRRAEKLLAQNELGFRQVFENISECMIITQRGKIVEVNNAYENIYGESSSLIDKEMGIKYLIDKFYIDDIKDKLPIDYKQPFILRGRILRKDGEPRFVRIKHQLISEERGVLLICDITSQMQKNMELERLRGEFFANLSHEFKTPVNLIHSALQLLRLKLQDLSVEEIQYDKCFNICTQNISRLLKLISNLIDSTKIDSGYFKYNPQNYDIIQVAENITLSVVDYCEQNGLN